MYVFITMSCLHNTIKISIYLINIYLSIVEGHITFIGRANMNQCMGRRNQIDVMFVLKPIEA